MRPSSSWEGFVGVAWGPFWGLVCLGLGQREMVSVVWGEGWEEEGDLALLTHMAAGASSSRFTDREQSWGRSAGRTMSASGFLSLSQGFSLDGWGPRVWVKSSGLLYSLFLPRGVI